MELLAEQICNQQQPITDADAKSGVSGKLLRRSCYKRGPQQLLRLKFGAFYKAKVLLAKHQKSGVESIAKSASVCSDSKYNLPAITIKRRIIKAVAFNA